jgi:hypothetical protein
LRAGTFVADELPAAPTTTTPFFRAYCSAARMSGALVSETGRTPSDSSIETLRTRAPRSTA